MRSKGNHLNNAFNIKYKDNFSYIVTLTVTVCKAARIVFLFKKFTNTSYTGEMVMLSNALNNVS